MPWSLHSFNDCMYSYFTRNICNRFIDSLTILFGAMSEACSAIVTTIWRPRLNVPKLSKFNPVNRLYLVLLKNLFKTKEVVSKAGLYDQRFIDQTE